MQQERSEPEPERSAVVVDEMRRDSATSDEEQSGQEPRGATDNLHSHRPTKGAYEMPPRGRDRVFSVRRSEAERRT
jgi:hypothetical protein